MGIFVYALCALTSLGCCALLLRHHQRQPQKLLFHSAIAFLCFAVANILLFIDLIVLPQVDLRFWRNLVTIVGILILLVALINLNGRDER
jgi:uncharacterized membrane protein